MASLLRIQSDTSKEQSGVKIPYPGTDLIVLIARATNPRFEEAVRSLRTNARGKKAIKGELSSRESLDAIAPAVANNILLGWENLTEADNTPIPYTPEKALAILKDPASTDFFTWILQQANDPSNFGKDEVERAIAGNS